MDEKMQVAIIFIATLFLGILAISVSGFIADGESGFNEGLTADSYDVVWYDNGTLTERYVYDVRDSVEYRMLYRVWAAPLYSASQSQNVADSSHIELVGMKTPDGTAGYIKTKNGEVYLFNADKSDSSSLQSFVSEKAYPSEAGIVDTGYFDLGKYEVEFTYKIYPPIEYDEEASHISLMFASDHIPYRNVKITLVSDGITDVFMHPPGYDVVPEDGKTVITGSSPEDEIIEAEMLLTPAAADTIPGYKEYVTGVTEKTKSANSGYESGFSVAETLANAGKIIVLIVPFLLVILYIAVGREKQFTVPKYLSTLPNRHLTPWQVNLLFKGDAFESDENGFYATLLSLHKQKKIKLTEKEDKKGILIEILDGETDDRYEQKVFGFISANSGQNGILDTGYFEEVSKRASGSMADERIASALKENINAVMSASDDSVSSKYAADGRGSLLLFYAVGAVFIIISMICLFIYPDASSGIFVGISMGVVVILQAVIATLFPSTLYGRWKDDYYKEKLEWDSFKRFVSDLSQIKKYGTEDLNMWGEWLIYATALGAGDKVEAAMKEMNVNISDGGYFYPHYIWFMGFHTISTFSPPSQGGSGGGFGAGGGFGGGGAGGR